jgi:hypothetical protein
MGVPYRRSDWVLSCPPLASAYQTASAFLARRELYDAIFPAPAFAFNDAPRLAFSSVPFDPYPRPKRSGRHYHSHPKTDGATLRVLFIATAVFLIVSALSAWLLDS